MKRITALVIMISMLMGISPTTYAVEPYVVNNLEEGRYSYCYEQGERAGLLGLIDEEGNILTEPLYDQIEDFQEGYAQVCQGEQWGLIDLTGKVCVPVKYHYVRPASDGFCVAFLDEGKCGYLHAADGVPLTDFIYEDAGDFRGFGSVSRYEPTGDGNAYCYSGAVDRRGELVVPMEYSYVSQSGDGKYYIVENWVNFAAQRSNYGAYNLEGELIFPCEFTSKERLLAALANGKDDPFLTGASSQAAGLEVTWYPEYEAIARCYGTDRMVLTKAGRAGLFGLDGTAYTSCVYDVLEYNGEKDIFLASQNGKWGRLDRNGAITVPLLYETKEEALANHGVFFTGKGEEQEPPYALMKLDGIQLTGYDFWAYRPFVNGFAMVTDGGIGWKFIDISGKAITEQKYSGSVQLGNKMGGGEFGEDGYAVVLYEDHSGYNVIDSQGREILPEVSVKKPYRAGFGFWGYSLYDKTTYQTKVGISDSLGNVIVTPQYPYATSNKGEPINFCFDENGVMQVGEEYINTEGERVEEPLGKPKTTYEDPDLVFHESLRWIDKKGNHHPHYAMEKGWGFENEIGELVIPYLYDAVGYFDQGYASVRLDGIYGMLKNPLIEDEDAHKVSDWAAAEVEAAAKAGYVTPRCSTYQTHTITRLQFAELAVNYLEKVTGETITPGPVDTFTDTEDETVLKAYAVGIVQGVGEGRFDPGGKLTREQLATMLWRAMSQAGMTAGVPADLTAYSDGNQVASWAQESLSALVRLEIMEGTGGNALSPKASCTVEQAILLVYRAAGKGDVL